MFDQKSDIEIASIMFLPNIIMILKKKLPN